MFDVVLRWANGKAFTNMHKAMTFGRMGAMTGLVVTAKSLGMIIAGRPSASTQATPDTLHLGRQLMPYTIPPEGARTATQIMQHILDVAAKSELVWPSSADSLRTFAEGALELAQCIRSHRDSDGFGFVGGQESGYQVKHFVRSFLLGVQESQMMAPGALDNTVMQELSRWVPDQNQHLEPLMGWSCSQVQSTLGIHALWLACWMCLAASMTAAEAERCLGHEDVTLLAPVLKYERGLAEGLRDGDDPIFPPGPRVIAQELPELQ
jgi:hypothetical protein